MGGSKIVLAAIAALAAAGLASAATAATVFDTSLPSPGVIYGSGNPNDHFAVTTKGGVTVGLKSKITYHDTVTPVGDVYSFALGTPKISFDYAVIPGSVDLSGATAMLTLLNVGTAQTFSFDPSLVPDNATSGSAYENSEQLGFFPALGFDPSKNDIYDVTLSLSNVRGIDGVVSVENVIEVGTGVPEPASWALLILGLGGAGAALRRSRKSAIAGAAIA